VNNDNGNWQENLALGLGVANAALEALTGGQVEPTTTAVEVYQEPSDWEKYGPYIAGIAGVLLLAVLIKR
tara:strand:+ start:352 stop:561 length:210 start_codon:yes stop_codon:yes gene_type:complete